MASKPLLLLFFIFFSLQCFSLVTSVELDVGGIKGWVVPPTNESSIYNQWASKNRFRIGDVIRFKYGKDSVMLVTEEEYKECNSTHPIFFSNNGNTIFKFDRSGFFYFISGVAGHCQRGQKMIIKVMAVEDNSPPSSDNNPTQNNAIALSSSVAILVFTSSFVSSFLF